jgi:hypothetical protein
MNKQPKVPTAMFSALSKIAKKATDALAQTQTVPRIGGRDVRITNDLGEGRLIAVILPRLQLLVCHSAFLLNTQTRAALSLRHHTIALFRCAYLIFL